MDSENERIAVMTALHVIKKHLKKDETAEQLMKELKMDEVDLMFYLTERSGNKIQLHEFLTEVSNVAVEDRKSRGEQPLN